MMQSNVILIVWLITALKFSFGINQCETASVEISALQNLYTSTAGPYWLWKTEPTAGARWNFTERANPCSDTWQGVTCVCNNLNESVIVQLQLPSYGLKGKIPPAVLQNLPFLTTLNLEGNFIGGPLQIYGLKNLSTLNLGENMLTSTLPTLCAMPNLKYLVLSDNKLTGTLPKCFPQSIEILFLDGNDFRGPIEASIKALRNSKMLVLANNSFTGTLPIQLGDMRNLTVLDLQQNYFSASIPDHLFVNLTQLTTLNLQSNNLVGPIPQSLARCSKLHQLRLDSNALTGPVPLFMASLLHLRVLTMSGNVLRGKLVSAFNASAQRLLKTVDLSQNQFTGPIPDTVFELPALSTLSLYSNCFAGSIPSTVCGARAMGVLVMDGLNGASSCRIHLFRPFSSAYSPLRAISGPIPSCIWGLRNLSTLHLSGNLIHTSLSEVVLPPDSALQNLALSNNDITGRISPSLQAHSFAQLDIRFNKITGTLDGMVPLSKAALQGNNTLLLSSNRLSGMLPSTFHEAFATIDVLGGNLFDCVPGSLPLRDPSMPSYACGSQALSQTIIVNFVVMGAVLLCMLCALIYRALETRGGVGEGGASRGRNTSGIGGKGVGGKGVEGKGVEGKGRKATGLEALRDLANMKRLQSIDLMADAEAEGKMDGDGVDGERRARCACSPSEWVDEFTFWIDEKIEAFVYYSTGQKLWDRRILKQPNIHRLCKLLLRLRELSIFLTLAIVIVMVPLYSALTFGRPSFATHTYEYGWLLTSAFYSGEAAAIALLMVWLCLAGLSVWRAFAVKGQLRIEEEYAQRKQGVGRHTQLLQNISAQVFSILNIRASAASRTNWRNHFRPSHKSKVVVLTALLVLMNVGVIVTVNAAYVYSSIGTGLSTLQKLAIRYAIAAFKMFWNFAILSYFVDSLAKYNNDPTDKKIIVFMAMLGFNNVVAPAIATAFANEDCFLFAVQPPPPSPITYSYSACATVAPASGTPVIECIVELQKENSLFLSPFVYSYQCSSMLIVNYVPLYNVAYTALVVFGPLLKVMLVKINPRTIPSLVLDFIPGMLWPYENPAYFKQMVDPDREIILQILHLFMLLTFGMTSVQLAVTICLSGLLSSLVTQIFIVRYLKRCPRIPGNEGFDGGGTGTRAGTSIKGDVGEQGDRGTVSTTTAGSSISGSGSDRSSDSLDPETQGTPAGRETSWDGERHGMGINDLISASPEDHSGHRSYVDTSGGLEKACSGSWRRLLNGIAVAYMGATLFYGAILFDVAADSTGWKAGIWVFFSILAPASLYIVRSCSKAAFNTSMQTDAMIARMTRASSVVGEVLGEGATLRWTMAVSGRRSFGVDPSTPNPLHGRSQHHPEMCQGDVAAATAAGGVPHATAAPSSSSGELAL